ncbi:hypothetical protein DENIS_4463 [Desulfonema ishimotonii]|uniref:Teneurin-like YD-shell domain-containing protein n=1 Tax=Desulfonema ishimotonii TaxID=45657 RepID=A0A401G2J8_9BACT|nr:hypothetical protein DENIS_4463 [Desulfonema ishimotonii]
MSRYDGLGRRESVENSGAAFAQTRHNIYAYNDRNELTGSERKAGSVGAPTAVVDAEGRLYEYDPIGNRINSAGGTDPQVTYARNAVNQYTALTGGVNASPVYDDDGNMTGYDGNTYTWNAENRLIAAETADKRITFLYDYMGRRVRKQVYSGTPGSWNAVPDETRVFVYDGWNLIRETVSGTASSETYYVWGLDLSQGMQGAGGIGGLVCGVSGGEVRRYAYDANGNVGQLVNESGVIVARYEYDPFGNEVRAEGTGAQGNPFRFSTKYYDAETGLYYYGFRYYHSELGRWISRDPLKESGGWNLYFFVGNNPLINIDLFGLFKNSSQYVEPVIEKVYQHGNNVLYRITSGAYITHILTKIPAGVAIAAGSAGSCYIGYMITSWAIEDTWLDGGLGAAAYDLQETVRKWIANRQNHTPDVPQADNPLIANEAETDLENHEEITLQIHHYATNKNQQYTPEFERIICKYGLELDESWNKRLLPHKGRHAERYHDWMLEQFREADSIAAGDKDLFIQYLNGGAFETVQNHPEMLTKEYWDRH